MTWVLLAVIAYFLDAVVFVLDRFLLTDSIPDPIPYAFYAASLSFFAFLLLPIGIHFPGWYNFAVASISGLTFFVALIYLFKSIKAANILEAAPTVGVATALTSLAGSMFLLGQYLNDRELIAFFMLVAGTFILSFKHFKSRAIFNMIAAGVLFGVSSVTLKYFFDATDFANGLFWTRFGTIIGMVSLLIYGPTRKRIFSSLDFAPPSSKFLFVLNKILAGVAFIILYYAIKIGSVVFVSALQGVQYIFMLFANLVLLSQMPLVFERHTPERLWQIIWATTLVVLGFILLFIPVRL